MTILLLSTFLVLHGVVHLLIWLPRPQPGEADRPTPPFDPGRSAVLEKVHVRAEAERGLAAAVAGAVGGTYVLGALVLPFSLAVAAPVLIVAAVLGLLLKATYFNPWLLVGAGLDLVVLLSATAWMVATW